VLAGSTVMITGASSGIGAAAARYFAEQGAAVLLMSRRKERLDRLVEEINGAGGRAAASAGDVTSPADVERAVAAAVGRFGSLDAAFNNAGWGTAGTPLHEVPDELYDQIMDVNVRGVWNCLRRQIPAMVERGVRGAIVNTSSTAGQFATGAVAPYVAAKHAVIGLTKAAAAEYGDRGIRVNALVVGSTRTPLMEKALMEKALMEKADREDPRQGRGTAARAIQHRLADPLEIARAAAWLCSDQASFVTGAAVPVDGGCSAV